MTSCQSSFVVFSVDSYGGATSGMYLVSKSTGAIEFTFWRKSTVVWRVTTTNVVLARWHHVAVTWSETTGLSMYINGKLSSTTELPTRNISVNGTQPASSDDVTKSCLVAVDDFNFRSIRLAESDLGDLGE